MLKQQERCVMTNRSKNEENGVANEEKMIQSSAKKMTQVLMMLNAQKKLRIKNGEASGS